MRFFAKIHPLVWIGLASVLIIAGGVVFISQLGKPAGGNSNVLGEAQQDAGRQHIPEGSPLPQYSSNPPTSGPHYPSPASTGIYDSELPDGQLIHNLEHGHIWISYKPNLSADQIAKLKEIVGNNSRLVILSPRAANPSPVALASWQRLLLLDNVDEKTIVEFIKKNRGNAPEFVP